MREHSEGFPDGLDVFQRAAVTYQGPSHLLVLAGPGSGKTLTITRRIRYLLTQEKIPPEKILAVTFTRAAALSMQKRFLEEASQVLPSNPPSIPRSMLQTVNFGTFHSVFYQLLKQSGHIQEERLLRDADKKKLLEAALFIAAPEISRQEGIYYSAELLSAIGYYKNTEDPAGAVRKAPVLFQKRFLQIYREYERARQRSGGMDYDDILSDCRRLLQANPALLAYWQDRFEEILIDEFQDMNLIQYEILRLLGGGSARLFAVGDDDQSIYGFRGARPQCMKRFLEEFSAKKILLQNNYRSSGEIVRASLSVIGENQDRFPKELCAVSEKKGAVRVLGFAGKKEEREFLVNACREEGECAVLFRTNRLMQKFARCLEREKIDYEMKERGRSIYFEECVQDVLAYLYLAKVLRERSLSEGGPEAEQSDRTCLPLSRVINRPSRYVSREALRGVFSEREGRTLQERLRVLEARMKQQGSDAAEKIALLSFHLEKLRGMSLHLGVWYVRRVIGYDRFLQERYAKAPEERRERLELLDWLGEEAKEYQDLTEWMEDQRRFGAQRKTGQKKSEEEAPPGIQLLTVHGAKGLEFERVILPDCNERIFPYGQLPDADAVEEERRLFYVGMTRAKSRLDLLYVMGSREYPAQPSRFLSALQDQSSSSNSALSRNSSKASLTSSYSSSSSI